MGSAARWPDLHVYHYAHYEPTALKRLMSEHATREEELDDLLRREVFVDLYQVVRQSLRISHASYSIKSSAAVLHAGRWQGRGHRRRRVDPRVRAVARHRRPAHPRRHRALQRGGLRLDVRLRDWLLERRRRSGAAVGVDIPFLQASRSNDEKPDRDRTGCASGATRERLDALGRRLGAHLLGDLLDYHRREAKPDWWAYFDRRKKSLDELLDDTEAIAYLTAVPGASSEEDKQSLVHTLEFPPQEFKLKADDGRRSAPRRRVGHDRVD